MALGDFFRINMPYGMMKNEKDEWFVFNREYKPLGWNTVQDVKSENFPVYTKYESLSEVNLLKLACPKEDTIHRNMDGTIFKVWFYSDGTNPKDFPEYWDNYFKRIKLLSNLKAV